MKKIAFLFMMMLVLTGCGTKSSSDTSIDPSLLIGKWETSETDYEDGMETDVTMCYNFINGTDFKVELNIRVDGGYLGKMTYQGTYEIWMDKLIIDVPKTSLEINVNRGFFDSDAEYRITRKAFEKEMRKDFNKDIAGESIAKIMSLTSDQLILEEDEGLTTYNKI